MRRGTSPRAKTLVSCRRSDGPLRSSIPSSETLSNHPRLVSCFHQRRSQFLWGHPLVEKLTYRGLVMFRQLGSHLDKSPAERLREELAPQGNRRAFYASLR